MVNVKVRLLAKRIIEEKLGLKVANTDLVLLEAGENENGQIDYIYFTRRGFEQIGYEAHMGCHKWILKIHNLNNDTKIELK